MIIGTKTIFYKNYLILCFSGQKEFTEGLDLIDTVLEEYPDNLGLMSLKVRLSEVVYGGERALNSAKDMMHQWQIAVEKMQAEEQQAEANAITTSNTGIQGNILVFRACFRIISL